MPRDTHSESHYPASSHRERHLHSRDETLRSRSRSPPRRRSRDRSPKRRDRSRDREYDRERSRRHSRSRDRDRSHSRDRKHRHRSRSRSKDRRDRRKRDRSPSVSSSSSSDSDSNEGTSHRRKKDKRKDKERKSDRKERKREKKERRKEKKRKKSEMSWGKYGIITDIELVYTNLQLPVDPSNFTSIFTKSSEFHTWLLEERKINPETLSKDLEKKEFSRFVEDYNTATLPHEKYYNMEVYDRRMTALREGEDLPFNSEGYDFSADMNAIRNAHKRKPVEQESYLSKEQLMELRRVQQERSEMGRRKLLGMDIKQDFGVRMDGTNFDDV